MSTPISTGEIVIMVSSITAGVVAVINAVGGYWGKQEVVRKQNETLVLGQQIHDLTNGNLTLIKSQLAAALARIEGLEARITVLTSTPLDWRKEPPIDASL